MENVRRALGFEAGPSAELLIELVKLAVTLLYLPVEVSVPHLYLERNVLALVVVAVLSRPTDGAREDGQVLLPMFARGEERECEASSFGPPPPDPLQAVATTLSHLLLSIPCFSE